MGNDKTIIVTGASQGLGAEIAQRLAKDGFNIAINCYSDNEVKNGGDTVATNCREFGVKAECFVADVSKYDQCQQMVNDIKEKFGSIDGLVNNAGITKDGLLVRMSEEAFDAVTNVNYKGVFNMTKLVASVMMRQKSGRIVNVSSVAGVNGNAGQFNYSASKAGVIGMTKTAAKELGPRGILVNAIAPGFIETDMTAVLPDDLKESIKKQISLKRYGKPKEVAGVVSFLFSPDSSYVSGQVILIDGCLLM